MNSNLAPLARICTTRLIALLTIFTVTLLVTSVCAATEQVLHKFNNTDGAIPFSSLILDAAGNLYGTTVDGGNTASCDSDGCGTVFELTPKAGGGWRETVLHRFASGTKDGHFPHAGVVFDASGNLYGTTAFGGSGPCTDGCGTVFELTPQKSGGWTEKLLHSFTGKDGRYAEAALVFDASGNLYGTTPVGGAYGYGTVFELTRKSGGTWAVVTAELVFVEAKTERYKELSKTPADSEALACLQDLSVESGALEKAAEWVQQNKMYSQMKDTDADEEGKFHFSGIGQGFYTVVVIGRAGMNDAYWEAEIEVSFTGKVVEFTGEGYTQVTEIKLTSPKKACYR
jgi:uncharacterized repeat protein (TIGR03803 family)